MKYMFVPMALAFGMAIAALPHAGAETKPATACFRSNEWDGWRATKDSKSIFIRERPNRVFRLDLASACPDLQVAGAHLIAKERTGTSMICNPLDIDLSVSATNGFATPCIVSAITPLTGAQAAALPKGLRP